MVKFYVWSNIDGDILIYNNWEELLNDTNAWNSFDRSHDSLDYAEVGFIIDKKSLDESEGRALCVLDPFSKTAKEWFTKLVKENQIIEYTTDFPECDIKRFYLGIPLIMCTASQCEQKTNDLNLNNTKNCTYLQGIETIRMDTVNKLTNTGWEWLLKTYKMEDIQHLYIDIYGKSDVDTTEFLPDFMVKGIFAIIIDGRIHEGPCNIYYKKEGKVFILQEQYDKLYGC